MALVCRFYNWVEAFSNLGEKAIGREIVKGRQGPRRKDLSNRRPESFNIIARKIKDFGTVRLKSMTQLDENFYICGTNVIQDTNKYHSSNCAIISK